ncbi:GntR family transcriptional regulator [Planotetraspora thailandica]|uniref:GntR family transcriptional regulator n=1 Tax=Planotetraspora thailandica TaxID=487172 RepID=A0A8J4DF85_9ACTN|nr:PLP-dependent aminotransferase family protein [Planotetraspora thailandica]GII59326.1 GntR family transcriptional regulator [Planotetraspora thailandica]
MQGSPDDGRIDFGSGLDLHLDLPGAGGVGRSLEVALREAVRSGRLTAGTRLPGTRGLAADLGLSRGTVVQAYTQLIAEGWLTGTRGSGTWVADVLPESHTGEDAGHGSLEPRAAPLGDLRPGRPDVSTFPRAEWVSSVRRVMSAMESEQMGYPDPAGMPALRSAVADYVSRTRGVWASAGSTVITAGFTQALALLGRTFRRLGARSAATENPGFVLHRQLLASAGLAPVPLAVDADGADPSGLLDGTAFALLTPAHQHPWGVVLAPGRRSAFIDWARRTDAYVIEDDYDGEFRYDQQPVGAMQALAPDRVIYAGSTSKTLAPGARLGWLVVPATLRDPLLQTVRETGSVPSVIDQLVLADLLSRGDYDRHVRRARLGYRQRRHELAERLAVVTDTLLTGVAAGLHALLPVASAAAERELVATAERAGLLLHGLHTARYWHPMAEERPAALVIGYATPPQHAWRGALDVLVSLVGRPPGAIR